MNKQNKEAFSLIEVMIILLLVSIGILATIPILSGKTYSAPDWIRKIYTAGNIPYISYGQDNSSNERVGIQVDPYAKGSEGKLSVGAMGVSFNNVSFPKFIFGGRSLNGIDFDGGNVWADGAISNINTDNALIIGRTYSQPAVAGVAGDFNLSDSTIISSFSVDPAAHIHGICIGNIDAGDVNTCADANHYNLNSAVQFGYNSLGKNFYTKFLAGGAEPIQIIDSAAGEGNFTIDTKQGLLINGDLYASNYNYPGFDSLVRDSGGPYVREANFVALSGGLVYYNYSLINDELSGTAQYAVPTTNYGQVLNGLNTAGVTDLPGKNGSPSLPLRIIGNNVQPTGGTYSGGMAASDIRLKNILKPYEKGLDYIAKVKTHYYTFKNDVEKKLHAGIIAQEIIGIFDEALEKTKDGFYSYKKSPFLYAMVNSVKSLYSEQQDILKEQEELLKSVKNNV